MKKMTLTFWLFLFVLSARADIVYHGTAGQTLYVRVQTGPTTFVAEELNGGTGGGQGVYTATDAALVTDGLSGSSGETGWPYTIRVGGEHDTQNDPIVGEGVLYWSGSVELPAAADARRVAGDATPATNLGEAFDADATGGPFLASTFGVTGATTFTGNVWLYDGLTVTRTTPNQPGISAFGEGPGPGVKIGSELGSAMVIESDANDSGHGIHIISGGAGDGIHIFNNGDGGKAISAGYGIEGSITGNLSGSVNSVTNRVTANTDQWAGVATATDDIALKSSLAKGIDISGFNDPTAAANATAVRTELATELARLDASVSSRHASGAAVASVTGDIGGSVVGSVGSVSGFSTGALADLFDTNSGKSYSDAVAGSVVKEVADHATTPSLTAAGIADAVLDELLAGHTATGSLSKAVSDVYDFLNGAPTFAQAMNDQGYTTALASKLDTNVDAKISEIPAKLPSLLVTTAIDDATPSQTSFVLADGPANDNALNGALVIVMDDSNPTSVKKAVGLVKDYDQATKTVTLFADPGGFTFADGNKVDVIASGVHQPLW